MKRIASLFLAALAGLVLCGPHLTAQTLNVLHEFTSANPTNLDGGYPLGGLVLSGNTLYGTASTGGSNAIGTVFSVTSDGSVFTVLYTFTETNLFSPINVDGFKPEGALILSGNTLYGAAAEGGTNGSGTVFSVNAGGGGFGVLYTFATNVTAGFVGTNAEGAFPNSLVLSGDTLYGTASGGGSNGFGTLFSINTNSGDFSVMHTFRTNDGENPANGLLLATNVLYGTARNGGTNGYGTVYSFDTTSANFKVLHTFTLPPNGTNRDGAYPSGGLVLSGSTLYGSASAGGTNSTGTLFSVSTTGSNFTVIHTFSTNGLTGTNLDGANPEGTLTLAGDALYGTAELGGTNMAGTIFSVSTNGSGFKTLYAFSRLHLATNFDGARPETGMVLSGGTLYGTAHFGGASAYGTVFGLAILPAISSFNFAGSNVVLNAANGIAGETCTALASGDASLPLAVWTPIASNVLTSNGNFTITATNAVNPAAPQQFYTLKVQ